MTDHSREVDLLVIGGLTIDRFADGSVAPGGSVLHAGHAVQADRLRQASITVAGDESEATAGLQHLRSFGDVVRQPAASTTIYRHERHAGRRVLVLESGTEPISPETVAGGPRPRVALVAPIGDELPLRTLEALRGRLRPQLTVLLIQGWLRRLLPGREVEPLALGDVSADLWRAFSEADAVVLSAEDVRAAPPDPAALAGDLRRRLGPRPILALTLGTSGYLLDEPSASGAATVPAGALVEGVSTVGAGDAFGATFAVRLGQGDDARTAAAAAAERVVAILESRR